MRFEAVQGDTKPLERRIKHDGLGALDPETVTALLTVEGVGVFAATPTIVAGVDCVTFTATPTIGAAEAPGVRGMQWTLTAPDFSCTLPCEPDCLIICEKVS